MGRAELKVKPHFFQPQDDVVDLDPGPPSARKKLRSDEALLRQAITYRPHCFSAARSTSPPVL